MATYLTTEELAEYLRIPVSSIYQWRVHRTGPKAARVDGVGQAGRPKAHGIGGRRKLGPILLQR